MLYFRTSTITPLTINISNVKKECYIKYFDLDQKNRSLKEAIFLVVDYKILSKSGLLPVITILYQA